jgi:hypothetical protein
MHLEGIQNTVTSPLEYCLFLGSDIFLLIVFIQQ